MEYWLIVIVVAFVYETIKRAMKHKHERFMEVEKTRQMEIQRDMGIWTQLENETKKEIED
jgi:hypothetical protein